MRVRGSLIKRFQTEVLPLPAVPSKPWGWGRAFLSVQSPGGDGAKGMMVFTVSPGHLGTKWGGALCPGWKMPHSSSEWPREDSPHCPDVSLEDPA